MIKAKAKNTIILGLSRENIIRLKAGQPIKFDMTELGVPDMTMFIFYGDTEGQIEKMFREQGLINENTIIHK